jgi:hypothetical protein
MAERTQDEQERGYEAADVQIEWPLVAAASLILGLAVTFFLSRAMLDLFVSERGRPPATQLERSAIVPPSPHLERTPTETLAAVRAHEEALLVTLGWVDRSRGVVRIPIEDAMRLMATRGWPAPETDHESAGPR